MAMVSCVYCGKSIDEHATDSIIDGKHGEKICRDPCYQRRKAERAPITRRDLYRAFAMAGLMISDPTMKVYTFETIVINAKKYGDTMTYEET